MTDTAESFIPLGKTAIQVSPLGIGAWAWGDKLFWAYGRSAAAGGGFTDDDIHQAFNASLDAGVNFFDTAEVYGSGRSERLLGGFLPAAGRPVVVATKFMPLPWRLTKGAMLRALRGSLKRLGLEQVDLYQVHWPTPPVSIETWADALADIVQAGLARSVGVSNYNESQMRRAYSVLARRGVPLASNQVEYHLLNRKVELNGLLQACQELGITLIAYSPLAQGALTGKYSAERPLPGVRGRRYNRAYLEKTQPLLQLMREIGRTRSAPASSGSPAVNGPTPAQVALNWLICKGTLPIPGAKTARQALDNCGALGWRLTPEEVAALDQASLDLQ